jgi:deoxyribonuclease-4
MNKAIKHHQILGAHTSTQGGVSAAVTLAQKLGFTGMQIFTKNNNRWQAKPLSKEEIKKYKSLMNESGIQYVVSHDSYLINLCAKDDALLEKSRTAFIDELQRCKQLGITHLNFHPGAHGGMGEKEGIRLIADSLNYCHSQTSGYKVKSMLELTAGQGTALGSTFEQIAEIISLVKAKKRMCVCIDTAHIFAAGYDIRDKKNYRGVMKHYNEIIGAELLQCYHLNDSKKELGSRVDRHEHIGKGHIGLEGFRNIMNDEQFFHVPKILETPKEKGQFEDIENLKVLRSLIK